MIRGKYSDLSSTYSSPRTLDLHASSAIGINARVIVYAGYLRITAAKVAGRPWSRSETWDGQNLPHYPRARLILGHGGETLPFSLWRFDSRWLVCNRGARRLAEPPSFYIRRNIAVTTSGMCSDDPLRCSLDAMGAENVMFSIDFPFEKTELAARFIETAKVTEAERIQVASGNATRVLHFDRHRAASHQEV